MSLHHYQDKGIEFGLDVPQNYLALDMGMGKTVIALNIIMRAKQKAIVFGPLMTILNTWPAEIKKWAPHLTYCVVHGLRKSLANIEGYDILLVNYEGIDWFSKQVVKWKPRMLVLDESSMLKSHSTQRFKKFKNSFPLWTERRICLSATPAPNSLTDLWSQYYLLDKGAALEKNISAFRKLYCTSFQFPGASFVKFTIDPRFVDTIYNKIAPITFRLKAEDYLDMPDSIYNSIECELPPALREKYKILEKQFVLALKESVIVADNAAALFMKLRQFVQGGVYDENHVWQDIHTIKVKALKAIVDQACGKPVLCAVQFKGDLAAIRREYPDVPVIAGETNSATAQKYIRAWNEGSLPLLLCHPSSLSHGVNLQSGGHLMVWFALTTSYERYHQLNGRLLRQGQRETVVIHHILMKDTLDQVMQAALLNKASMQEALLEFLRTYR